MIRGDVIHIVQFGPHRLIRYDMIHVVQFDLYCVVQCNTIQYEGNPSSALEHNLIRVK